MSTLKVDAIRHNSATSDAITTAADGTCTANITNNLSNRNLFINGALQIWQRGTSTTSSGSYQADRFWGAAGTYARDNSAPDGFQYSAKLTYVSPNAMSMGQPIELPATGHAGSLISGNKITISFYGKVDSGTESCYCQIKFRESKFSGTNEVGFTVSDPNLTLTTSWQRFSKTFTIPTVGATNTVAAFEVAGIDKTAYFTGFQAELGSVMTDYEHRRYAEELELCKRYYQQVYFYWNTGSTNSNYLYYVGGQFHPVMRAAPSLVAAYDNNNENSFETRDGGTWRTGLPSLIEAQPEGIVLRSNNNVVFNAIKGIAHFNAEL